MLFLWKGVRRVHFIDIIVDEIKFQVNFIQVKAAAFPIPSRCPACSSATYVERVRCGECGTAVEGHFSSGWTSALSPEQLAFVELFIHCRGKIKDVEQALGLSYPTVIARLDDVVDAMRKPRGHGARGQVAPIDARKQILDELAAGGIDADEAARRLKRL